MKKPAIIIMALLLTISNVHAQKKKGNQKNAEPAKTEAPAAQPAAPAAEVKDTTAATPSINPFLRHFLVKYQVASQFADYDVARDAIYDLLVENAGVDSLLLNLQYLYLENQKYTQGVLVGKAILARDSRNEAALEMTAGAFEALNIKDQALSNYETLYLVTNSFPAIYKMAFLQYELKKYPECTASTDIILSRKEADELTATFPVGQDKTKDFKIRVAILNLKGMVARENGDKPTAKKYFEQALALAADFQPAKENLSKLK
ncbi:MAG: hypothetical protein ACKOYP_07455 [Bacteroidota bacterium]